VSLTANAVDELRIGMIGLDTSHVTAFTAVLNDPNNPNHVSGAKVAAAFEGGSPDIESSVSRVDGYTKELRENTASTSMTPLKKCANTSTLSCSRVWTDVRTSNRRSP